VPDPFAFLRAEWPQGYEAAEKAQDAAFPDPRTACFYARRALDTAPRLGVHV
jgi:type I restriction enzyme R subunit